MKVAIRPEGLVRLALMSDEEHVKFVKSLTPKEALVLDASYEGWADSGQLPPSSEGWRVWLMMAGRGYGKTRAGAEWVNSLAQGRGKRIALVAATMDEARRVMVEGPSGLLRIAARDGIKVKWEPSLGQLSWPSGSVAQLYSGDNPDGLRGGEHHFAWCAAADRPPAGRNGRSRGKRVAAGIADRRAALSCRSFSQR